MEQTYKEFIDNILNTRGRFACGEDYHERHHIVPRCMDGTNDEDNLIDLFAREHFEAHRLLALENPNVQGLVYAWWAMCNLKDENQQRVRVSAEEYEESRKKFIEVLKGKSAWNKGIPMSEEQKTKLRQVKKGVPSKLKGVPMSDIAKQHMKENHANFTGENHPRFGCCLSNSTKEKIRQSRIGKKASEETKKKLSEIRKGKMGKPHTEEAKEKMRNYKGKSVRCIETNIIYRSSRQAERDTGVFQTGIGRVCNGKQETAGGFHWEFVEGNGEK